MPPCPLAVSSRHDVFAKRFFPNRVQRLPEPYGYPGMLPPGPDTPYSDVLHQACQKGLLGESALQNITTWLTAEPLAAYRPILLDHIRQQQWATLQDVFWTSIPFGTAGRRGRMYPIGTNAINERTIGETIQALATHVREVWQGDHPPACAIAYDTRHQSDSLARLCAEIMVAHAFHVYFFEGFRATPLLATTVRHKQCACGIMVSASHNPPTDNAAKVFWSNGGQLREPHDAEVTRRMESVGVLKRVPFAEGVSRGQIEYASAEMDAVYRRAVVACGFATRPVSADSLAPAASGEKQLSPSGEAGGRLVPPPRDLKTIYSPLHGVGQTSVVPVLREDGFEDIEVFAPHATPDGCFPNVPDHIANPENPAVFDAIVERAIAVGADLIIASDPDADRLGCSAPLSYASQQWRPLNGNQLATLLTEYVLRQRQRSGDLSSRHYVVKTLVTSDMMARVADSYGIQTHGDCFTGFKWIGSKIDELGDEYFVLGAEEAHGYLIGTHCRDKDGAVAAMLLAEMADEAKQGGKTLHDEMNHLYRKHGLHLERTIANVMPGADGMQTMQDIMRRLRSDPPKSFGGMRQTLCRDYLAGTCTQEDGTTRALPGPRGNVLIFESEIPGNRIAVRPSGTEPKIKFYLFTRLPPDQSRDLDTARTQLTGRLDAMQSDILAAASGNP